MTNLTTVETAETANQEKGKTINIVLEKLEGGFISNVTGKRAIYKDAFAITDAIDLEDAIKSMDDAEYHLDIRIVPKEHYVDYNALVALHNAEEDITLESARESGLIEKEKFSPLGAVKVTEPDINGSIKITAANCYTVSRLKSIDWKSWYEQLDMPIVDMAQIAGLKKETFYNTWANIMKGTYKYQRTDVKIGLTILAKYFENTLNVRTSTKEQCEKMKEDLGKMIRNIEVMGSGKAFIKTSEIQLKLIEMRKLLLI